MKTFEGLAEALGVEKEDFSQSLPAQVVSTGAGHLLVPVRNRTALDSAHPDAQPLAKILKAAACMGKGHMISYVLGSMLPFPNVLRPSPSILNERTIAKSLIEDRNQSP